MSSETVEQIRQRLTEQFAPSHLDIEDESYKHAGHEGAKSGGGHYIVQITSAQFAGKTPIQRHRMVHQALADLMHSAIHALSIQAKSPADN